MLKRLAIALCLLLLVATFIPRTAWTQAVYGNIFGTVTDPSGAAVANANITVTNVGKGTTVTATTNAEGNYSVTHLIPDEYKVRVGAPGFKAFESKPIAVSADTSSRWDAKLEVGSAAETVEVTAEAPQLKTDRSDVATILSETYVKDLPILNRNFTNIELLTPGAQYLGWGHAATENPQGSQQIMINGQHFSGTGFELDGTDNQDPILGIIVVNPNVDAITETKITTQNYDAEFGKAVAGLVTVQTKSGTNSFHGSGFYFRRTDATEARDPFTQSTANSVTGRFIPEDRWNQFGGTIGGPILKNKLFFFGDYQGTRQANGFTAKLTVPTAHVLSTCLAASGFCDLSQYVPFIGNGKAGDPSTLIYDPLTGDNTGHGRTPFCGPAGCAANPDWIPVSRLSPVAQNILSKFAALKGVDPNAVSNNFVGSGTGPFSQNAFDTRIDYDASQSVKVFGRFSLAYFSLSGAGVLGLDLGGVGTGQGGLGGSAITHNYSIASGVTKTFGPTLLADFRFGYFKYNPTTHKPDEGATPAKNYGIPNLNLGDLFTSGLPHFEGAGPGVNAGSDQTTFSFGDGLNVARCNCPLIESEQQFQWVNNWTKMHGNHQFKFGADIRYAMNLRVPSDANRTGILTFGQDGTAAKNGSVTSNGGVGGAGFATFLLGYVNHMSRFVSTSVDAAERQKRLFFYGEDSWRITPKFTLNYGVRWEIYFPESVNGKGNGGFANPEEGIIRVAGYGPYGLNGNIDNAWKAFAPRLGIAYEPTSKTVVRLGYGRSFDMGVFGSNFGHAVTQNLPVLVNQQVNAQNNFQNNTSLKTAFPGGVTTNDFFWGFTLSDGPPQFLFPAIPSSGALPLGGPANNVQPRMRPTFQRLPTLDAWNATVQRQLTPSMTAEVAYVGNKATHVFAGNGPAYDLNQVPYGPGTAIVAGKFADGAVPPSGTSCTAVDPGHGKVSCSASFKPTTPPDLRRPFHNAFTYPGFIDPTTGLPIKCCDDGIMGNYFGNDANAHYNALQVRMDKLFSHGLQFISSYTYSHATNQTNDNGFLYAVDRARATGPDDFNRNHVFLWNGVYQLPFGKGKAFGGGAGRVTNAIIGGWQFSNTLSWASGLPFTATSGNCGQINDTGPCLPNINNVHNTFHMGAGSLDPVTHTVSYFTPVSPLTYDFSTATVGSDACNLARPTSGAFALPACGTNGDVGRNTFRGPGAFWDNGSISKRVSITERFSTEFRVDAYNLFNHPVLANPGNCIDCGGNNGKITGLYAAGQPNNPGANNGMRVLQFGLKLDF